MLLYTVISIIAFIGNFLIFRKKIIEYEIIATIIYLFSFIYIKQLDIIFVVYFFFFVLPFIRKLTHQKYKKIIIFIFIYSIIQIFRGLINESVFIVLSVFFTRYLPIIFLMLLRVDDIITKEILITDKIRLLRIVAIGEIIIDILLYMMKESTDYFVVNHQPIGGNLSLVGIFLLLDISMYQMNISRRQKIECLIYSIVFIVVSLISSIRGYILVIIPCALFTIINLIFKPKKRFVGSIFSIIAFIIIIGFIELSGHHIFDSMSDIDTNIGYRTIENQMMIQTLKNSNPINFLFGYGLAASGKTISSNSVIAALAGRSAFYYSHLSTVAVFQNFWFSVLKDMGIIGLLLYVMVFLNFNKRKYAYNLAIYRSHSFYLILYAIMLFFRISCTCGLIELFIFCMISNQKKRGDIDNEFASYI